LLAVIDEPPAGTPAAAAWQKLVALLDKTEAIAHTFRDRRATAARQRLAPPPAMRKLDLCVAAPAPAAVNAGSAAPPPNAGSAAPPPSAGSAAPAPSPGSAARPPHSP